MLLRRWAGSVGRLRALRGRALAFSSSSSERPHPASEANALHHGLQESVARSGAGHRPLLAVYDELVAQGSLREDAAQRRVAWKLDRLARLLRDYTPPMLLPPPPPAPAPAPAPPAEGAAAAGPVTPGTAEAKEGPAGPLPPPPPPPPPPPQVLRGMYIHGQVGTGKSLLMDLFFHHCPLRHKRRVHFHAFMLEVHARIHAWKQRALQTEGRRRHIDLRPERNAIVQVAREVAAEAHVLCFDEFQVTDVADAVMMASFFGELWRQGVVVIATSNRAPGELYLDGINRPYFLPFIALLERQCLVVDMASGEDHRRRFRRQGGSYFWPLDGDDEDGEATAQAQLEEAYLQLTGGQPGAPTTIPVMMGRRLRVPRAHGGVCRFSFGDLCRADVFAADYRAICDHFHTLVLEGVPRLSAEKHNEARRFITLVDVLYETRTRLLMSAAAPPLELFKETRAERVSGSSGTGALAGETRVVAKGDQEDDDVLARFVDAAQELVVPEGELASVKELAFAFQRAASRLIEMTSEEYLEAHRQTRERQWRPH